MTIAGGTGQDGIPPKSIMKTLDTLGYDAEPVVYLVPGRAAEALRRFLHKGFPVIMCVDNDEHWVCAIGVLGSRFLVADPADAELVLSYDPEKLTTRWKNKTKKPYYGIVVSPKGNP